jgi:hypothetical protein
MDAIDGMLVWFDKQMKHDVKLMKCGDAKFFCGHKNIRIKYASCM